MCRGDLREMENGDAEDSQTLHWIDSETVPMKAAEKTARGWYDEQSVSGSARTMHRRTCA